jgi:peptidoglycan/LPS O-acetylase OafA/YrhL
MDQASPESPIVKPAQRVVGLDVARGALMAYIIIVIHGVFWLGLLPQPGSTVLLFEMPPIFIITGAAFFLAERAKPSFTGNRVSGYLMFLLRRGIRIMAPYWAYALVCAALMLTIGGKHDVLGVLAAWLNPYMRGGGFTTLTLSWHLWFVPPFLAVTALMPFLTAIRVPRLPLWVWAIIAAAITFVADIIDSTAGGEGQTIVFYALWAAFGFALAAAPERYKARDFVLIFVLALIALAAGAAWLPGATLNMQANKFPPNLMFFAFSCAWVSMLLLLVSAIKDTQIDALARSPLLKPFISAGYSVYMWQGIGYAAAILIGRALHWPNLAIWPIAIAFTVAIGLLASPFERIRLPRARAAPQR